MDRDRGIVRVDDDFEQLSGAVWTDEQASIGCLRDRAQRHADGVADVFVEDAVLAGTVRDPTGGNVPCLRGYGNLRCRSTAWSAMRCQLPDSVEVSELGVTVRMLMSLDGLGVALQAVVSGVQQLSHLSVAGGILASPRAFDSCRVDFVVHRIGDPDPHG